MAAGRTAFCTALLPPSLTTNGVRNMRKGFLLSSLLLLSLAGDSPAGWGGGDCGPVGSFVFSTEQGFQWQQSAEDSDAWALRLNGQLVGGWRQSTGRFFAWNGAGWAAADCPVNPPAQAMAKKADCPCCGESCNCAVKPCGKPDCKCVMAGAVVESDGTLNFGLSRAPLKPRRVHNGQEISRQQLFAALKANVPDESADLCLTLIGPKADREHVLFDLENSPLLAAFKDKLKVQAYTPDHWAVKGSGFVTSGHPTIYCQAPDGKVLHRQDSYAGPEALAEALRDANAAYDPAKDPNLNAPAIPGLAEIGKLVESVPGWAWAIAALLVYLRFFHKEKAQ